MKIRVVKRILRHKEPIAILPYYLGTREQELVQKFLENCDENNVKVINSVNYLKTL